MFASLALLILAADPAGSKLDLKPGWVQAREVKSEHATQAAAVDEKYIYAISNTTVAKHDRETGKLLGTATNKDAKHLNSAFVWQGKVYCAHSNYPKTPEESSIMVFDPDADTLTEFKRFERPAGSIVWLVHDDAHWWVSFAHYGKDNAKTVLLKCDDDFRELARWTFPKQVIDDWDGMSASGGIWDGDTLLATHHHFKVLYRLRVPKEGTELEFVEALTSPFPGQGIARDPRTGGLVGINRGAKAVVFAERKR